MNVTLNGEKLIGGPQVQVTDATGQYRFDRLPPGEYARNFFFRLPSVTLMNFRIPPEVMQDGIPLNFLPTNIEEAQTLFAGGAVPAHKTELVFAGPGARYFRDPVKVELLEFQETSQ